MGQGCLNRSVFIRSQRSPDLPPVPVTTATLPNGKRSFQLIAFSLERPGSVLGLRHVHRSQSVLGQDEEDKRHTNRPDNGSGEFDHPRFENVKAVAVDAL